MHKHPPWKVLVCFELSQGPTRDKTVGKFYRNRNNLAFREKDWLLCQKTDIKEVKKHRNLILHIIPKCIHIYTTYTNNDWDALHSFDWKSFGYLVCQELAVIIVFILVLYSMNKTIDKYQTELLEWYISL